MSHPSYQQKITDLIFAARRRMKRSRDTVHDLDHAERVAAFAEQLANDCRITGDQKQALILAAYWHDMARTLNRRTSLLIMPLMDDLISAFMLWYATIRAGLFGSVAGMATRLIFCKSLGAGAILTRLLMRRRNHILIDLLKDADTLDTISQERMVRLMPLVESSRRYHWSYKKLIQYLVNSNYLHMKTKAARVYAIKLLKIFLDWVQKNAIYLWHIAQFGKKWCARMLKQADHLLLRLETLQLM